MQQISRVGEVAGYQIGTARAKGAELRSSAGMSLGDEGEGRSDLLLEGERKPQRWIECFGSLTPFVAFPPLAGKPHEAVCNTGTPRNRCQRRPPVSPGKRQTGQAPPKVDGNVTH